MPDGDVQTMTRQRPGEMPRHWLLLAAVGTLLLAAARSGTAVTLIPLNGPTGKIVQVVAASGSEIDRVVVEGQQVRLAGAGTMALFTIPYGLPPGPHPVEVYDKAAALLGKPFFVVDATKTAPVPQLTGHELGYLTRHEPGTAGGGPRPVIRLVLYGSGFDTNSVVVLDDRELERSFPPGVPVSLFDETFLSTEYDRLLVALLDPAHDLTKGAGPYAVVVRNRVTGQRTDAYNVVIPERRILVEVHRMTSDKPGFSPPDEPEVVERSTSHELNSLRRIFTDAGYLLDIRHQGPQRWTHPEEAPSHPELGVGPFFSDREAVEFDRCLATLRWTAAENGEWYVHVSLLSRLATGDAEVLGLTLNESTRQGVAIFTSAIARGDDGSGQADPQQVVRTFAHELGHALNLTHCEDDGEHLTLMTRSELAATKWTFTFSPGSRTHLTGHPLCEVMPGRGNLPLNSPKRIEPWCGR